MLKLITVLQRYVDLKQLQVNSNSLIDFFLSLSIHSTPLDLLKLSRWMVIIEHVYLTTQKKLVYLSTTSLLTLPLRNKFALIYAPSLLLRWY